MHRFRGLSIALIAVVLAGLGKPIAAAPYNIVLIAGPPSHGFGAHEHYAGLKVLADSIREANPVPAISLHRGWPEDPSVVTTADAVVVFCDGGKRHVAMEHRDQIRALHARGGGLVCLHYAVEMLPGESGDDWRDLLGGHFEIHYSVNPHWVADIETLPKHPITEGVKPFAIDDEWYFHMRFSDAGKVTPILQAVAPEHTMRRADGHHSGNPHVRKSVAAKEPQTIAWTFEPKTGGRSFGFTGGHNHWNWGHEPVRRLVTNAILWAANMDLASSDAKLPRIGAQELLVGQDEPVPNGFNVQNIAKKYGIPLSATKGTLRDPSRAIAGLDIADDLAVELMGSEPQLRSLTNLDIDHRGRVWVCDVMNYRRRNGARPEGDRILILEDTSGDGTLDSVKTYYQGRDIDSAMGICVLGNEVIVSASPTVWRFTDHDGDDVPDQKTAMFTDVGQPQHDHSAHSFLFGPDGKLYWNFGNTGRQVRDAEGNTVVDIHGRPVVDDGNPLYGGMPFRCNLDGSEFEVLAHNFRNNWETTIDSFGSLWQSDNDDDGNRGTRINFVMEQGNYGYRDEQTGASWRADRITMEDEVPLQHWHLNDPGVVPNLLQTGAGSPSGMCLYEGRLLPKRFWDQMIHCEPGANIVRSYPTQPDGAGYTADVLPLVTGTRDRWFRPADVCVAPDGSIFVTDWYDPGVGGHRQGDSDRGRLFRIAPPGVPYSVPAWNFETAAGCVEALRSPNRSVRYMAWQGLNRLGDEAIAAVESMTKDPAPRMRARAYWWLSKQPGQADAAVMAAMQESNSDLRVQAIRMAKQQSTNVAKRCHSLSADASAAVRRELALALRYDETDLMPEVWAELAAQYDGRDRWYLEALGIGSDLRADECFQAWMQTVSGDWDTAAGRDIAWRTRAQAAAAPLAELIADPTRSVSETDRYFRSLEYHPDEDRQRVLTRLLTSLDGDAKPMRLEADADEIIVRAIMRMPSVDLDRFPDAQQAMTRHVRRQVGQPNFIDLVRRFHPKGLDDAILETITSTKDDTGSLKATRLLLDRKTSTAQFSGFLRQLDPRSASRVARFLGLAGGSAALDVLTESMLDSSVPVAVRSACVRALATSNTGCDVILDLAAGSSLPSDLRLLAGGLLSQSTEPSQVTRAAELLPMPTSKDQEALPPLDQLVKLTGDSSHGAKIFHGVATCAKCHMVDGQGKQVGPDLSEIGTKLSRESMYTAILAPSAGISHNYENYIVLLDGGRILNGLLITQDDERLILRSAEAIDIEIDPDDVLDMKKSEKSIMPENLHLTTDQQGLVDLVEYLMTLTKRS
ncbi:MAG: PVC-type heme-binding CxxCH protein [Planctomycetota bacterium]